MIGSVLEFDDMLIFYRLGKVTFYAALWRKCKCLSVQLLDLFFGRLFFLFRFFSWSFYIHGALVGFMSLADFSRHDLFMLSHQLLLTAVFENEWIDPVQIYLQLFHLNDEEEDAEPLDSIFLRGTREDIRIGIIQFDLKVEIELLSVYSLVHCKHF